MGMRRQKRNNLLVLLLLLLVGIGIGYAFLTSNLNIKGSSDIKKVGWDVHFENLVLGSDNVPATKDAVIDENDKTTVAYTIKLNKPGDKYEFTVDVVNSGNIDAVVSAVNKTGLTEEQAKYVEYTASYRDGTDVAEEDELKVGDTKNIIVSVKYKTDLNPEDLPNEDKVLSLKLEITYVQADGNNNSLYSMMKNNAVADDVQSEFVTGSTGINFSQISSDTNGKGVYMLSSTKDSTNPIYYYRGAVENNNVKFANFCWKIVRTTETGGIKLIYNGVPDEGGACNNTGTASTIGESAFNTNNNDNTYVGYMYGTAGASTYEETHKNTNDSTVKTFIDEWYKNNMLDYTEKLEDTVWCNDRTVVTSNPSFPGDGSGTTETWYGYGRDFKCNQNDKFTVNSSNGNGALTYPVALLTADEAYYAGMGGLSFDGDLTNNYLNIGGSYWTMTPYKFVVRGNDSVSVGAYVSIVTSLKIECIWSELVDSINLVRPSISLKSGTKIVSGDGSVTDPYVVA